MLLSRTALLALAVFAAVSTSSARGDEVAADDHAEWLSRRDQVLSELGAELPSGAPPEAERPSQVGLRIEGAPQVVGSDVRLALTQMALAAGSSGQAEIAEAQPPGGPGAIFIRAGSASLASLFEATRGTPLEPAFVREGDSYVALRPIVVVQGAELRLLPGDVLELDVAQGAFLLNFGHLSVAGATLRADPPGPGNEDGFRPFVASLGTGTLDVSWSVFVGLGSRVAPAASGLAVSSGSLFAAAGATSVIRDSRFIDVQGLTIIDGDRTVVTGNRFDRPRGVAIWVDDSQEVEVRGNYVVSPQGTFAARIDGPGRGVRFTDNVLVDGDHAGLRIAGTAAVVDLQGNVVSGFAGRGVVIEEGAGCIRLASNLIRENGGDGVSAQDVGDLIASGNVIAENGGAGVSLSRSRGEAEILVVNNLLAGNRSGVRTATIDALLLTGNDMSAQMPRHLAGDLTQHTPMFLRESRGGERAALAFRHVVADVVEPLAPAEAEAAFEACRAEAES